MTARTVPVRPADAVVGDRVVMSRVYREGRRYDLVRVTRATATTLTIHRNHWERGYYDRSQSYHRTGRAHFAPRDDMLHDPTPDVMAVPAVRAAVERVIDAAGEAATEVELVRWRSRRVAEWLTIQTADSLLAAVPADVMEYICDELVAYVGDLGEQEGDPYG